MWLVITRVTFLMACILIPQVAGGQSVDKSYVILVSFDGFRNDYVDKFETPNFKKLRKSGTHATGLIPTFPSKTFPNHYSIVTGLYPGNHGLVDNSFYDPERGSYYQLTDRAMVSDAYYYGGTPIWKLAKDHGLRTASFFWAGSEVSLAEQRPDYTYDYDETIPDTLRINQVIRWLQLPEEQRPRLITLYFSSPDHEGHEYGPHSPENEKAVVTSDSLVGMLMKRLETIDLPVNVIIVSDHGMAELKRLPETYIFLPEILKPVQKGMHFTNSGTHAHVYFDSSQKRDSLYQTLKKTAEKFVVYKPHEFPEDWHYNHPRSGDMLIVARPGYYIVDQERDKFLATIKIGTSFGTHGYDPMLDKRMLGIFYAVGPNIVTGKTVPPFLNIHIYPLIARLLNLTTPPIDGDDRILRHIVR